MQVKLFKFYIRYYDTGISAYQYIYVTSGGLVSATTTPTELPQAPKGWEELELKWERGFTLHGVFTNYTSPLNFVLDGAKILRYYYYNAGVDANLELFIEKHTNTVSTWGYATYYIGDIDFSRFQDAKDFVTISIMDSGFIKNLKAKEDSTLEIPVETNADKIFVMMDGIELQAVTQWSSIPNEECINNLDVKVPTFVNYLTKGSNFNLTFYDQIVIISNYFKLMVNNSDTITQDVDVECTYNYNIFIPSSASSGGYFTLVYQLVDLSDNTVTSEDLIYQTGTFLNTASSATYVGTTQNTISIPPKHSVVLAIRVYTTAGTGGAQLFPSAYDATQLGSELSLTLLNKFPTSYIPVIPMQTVGDAIIANIDSTYTLNSQPMIDKEDDYFLTSGDAIRGLAYSQLKTTFNDFYKAMDNMFMTGFYYDKSTLNCYIDYRANCYDTGTLTMSLGEVAKMNVAPLTQEMFNKLRIGYKPYSYDEINGKEEFNTEYEFQSPITRITTEKNLVSSYRADMYGIELTRANLDDKLQADSDIDNDIFWIHVDKSITGTIPAGYPNAGATYYGLYRDPTIITQGLISPSTAFNIEFSPKRRMNVHGAWLKATTHPSNYLDLKFNTSSKTTNTGVGLGTDDGVTIIIENQDETINSLDGTIMLFPIVFTIEVKTPINILDLLTNVPHGYIEFEWLGNPYSGYILEVSDMPTYTPKQTFKLIAQAGIDLTPLIV